MIVVFCPKFQTEERNYRLVSHIDIAIRDIWDSHIKVYSESLYNYMFLCLRRLHNDMDKSAIVDLRLLADLYVMERQHRD